MKAPIEGAETVSFTFKVKHRCSFSIMSHCRSLTQAVWPQLVSTRQMSPTVTNGGMITDIEPATQPILPQKYNLTLFSALYIPKHLADVVGYKVCFNSNIFSQFLLSSSLIASNCRRRFLHAVSHLFVLFPCRTLIRTFWECLDSMRIWKWRQQIISSNHNAQSYFPDCLP